MKKETKPKDLEIKLTDEEEAFCELYVMGGKEYAGQLVKCYIEVYGENRKNLALASRRLLNKPHITSRVKELIVQVQTETETLAIKMQVTETLKGVMEETSTAEYIDKWGIVLSPAPLRAVSVNAAKALMELYPIKHAQEAKLKIEGADGNVIFNVIVPDSKPKNEE